jgi:hypothetical protein
VVVVIVGGAVPGHVAGNVRGIVARTGVVTGIETMIENVPVTMIGVAAEKGIADTGLRGYGFQCERLVLFVWGGGCGMM